MHTRTHKHTHARMYARRGTSTRAHTHMLSLSLCSPPPTCLFIGVSSGKPVYTIVVPQTINDHSSHDFLLCVISNFHAIHNRRCWYSIASSYPHLQEYRCHYVRPMTDLPLSFQTRPVQRVYFSEGGRPTKRQPRKVDSANGKRLRGTKR